tara:strand:+ start:934 stop:1092 length:159 start_codon:yes stop_codon:yes gene_type:complete
MNLLKKLWNFLFGSKEEKPVVLEKPAATVQHCESHLRFRKNCPDCLRVVAVI